MLLSRFNPKESLRHYDRTASSGSVVEFTAMITETVFLGDIHRYTARCTSGKLVTSRNIGFEQHERLNTRGNGRARFLRQRGGSLARTLTF